MNSPLEILAQQKDQGQAIWFLNALSIIRVSSAQTGGAFALIEDTLPARRPTPYHMHHDEDETFYILEGEATFYSGAQKIKGTPGSVIFLPRLIPHGFRSDTAARMLIFTTPAGFDRFVIEAGEPAGSLTIPEPKEPDFGKLAALAEKFGIDILGPLPE